MESSKVSQITATNNSFFSIAFTALTVCLLGSTYAQTTATEKAIEDKVKAQMMQMIASYDLQRAIDSAVEEEMSKKAAQNTESIEQLLARLTKLLNDQNEINKLWPNAPANVDIFSNLNLEFNLKDGTV